MRKIPFSRQRMHVQRVIIDFVDEGIRESLQQMHEKDGSWKSDTWLLKLADQEFGYAGPQSLCAACNSSLMVFGALHASCCVVGEATRGDNAIAQLVHDAAQICDPSAEVK